MSAPIQFEATLDAARRNKDRSVTVRFTSMREMTTEDFAELDRQSGNAGHCLFRGNAFTDDDVPIEDVSDDSKTPAQRQRAVLFIYWRQLGEPGDFNQFYRAAIEKNINSIKEKLNS